MAKALEFQLPDREELDNLCGLIEIEVEEDADDLLAANTLIKQINEKGDEEWDAMEKPVQSFSNLISKATIAAKKAKKELVLIPTVPTEDPADKEKPKGKKETRTKPPAGKKASVKKEPTAAELKKMKADAKKKAEEVRKKTKTNDDYIGTEWTEGSSAQICLDAMKAAGKEGITIDAAFKVAEKKIESSNPKGRVATIFRAAVARDLAKSEDGVFTYVGKIPLKKKAPAKKATTTKRVKK